MPEKTADGTSNNIVFDRALYDTRAGVVVGAHGVQGTLKVKPVTGTSYKLFTPSNSGADGLDVLLGQDVESGRVVRLISSKKQEPKDIYLVRIRSISSRTEAELLVGQSIYGKSEDREELADDEFFVEDLIGLRVIDKMSRELGTLAVVHPGVANDVYETDQGLLIPAVKAFVEKIDLKERVLTVVDASALAME